ncbi:MAG: prepilin-type N-terminal cleavage/methylation domain-containing protein [Gammaproteobacteria bacterium]|nr:prepilin-type N-terminal cleavage/methylation domain-containing protein [Gammaproteobacteria bacterium]
MDRRSLGFTLLEMLVTLMLLAVLTAVAAPSL